MSGMRPLPRQMRKNYLVPLMSLPSYDDRQAYERIAKQARQRRQAAEDAARQAAEDAARQRAELAKEQARRDKARADEDYSQYWGVQEQIKQGQTFNPDLQPDLRREDQDLRRQADDANGGKPLPIGPGFTEVPEARQAFQERQDNEKNPIRQYEKMRPQLGDTWQPPDQPQQVPGLPPWHGGVLPPPGVGVLRAQEGTGDEEECKQ